jgi:LmbE family N-acetylglucosaminyl deacetylase
VLAAAYFDALRSSPVTTVPELTGGRPFVVLSPHPDDETLGAGGLIADACDHHQAVDVVVVTDGSGSHPRSVQYPRQRLIDLRYAEVHAAGEALGLGSERVQFLGLPDTMAPKAGAEFEAAVSAIHNVVRRSGAGSLFVTWAEDPHCDHDASAEMAKAVRRLNPDLKLWAYPIWGWHIDSRAELEQPSPGAFRIDITQYRDRKRRAIDAHTSQMTDLISDDPAGFRFNETSLAPFLGDFEYFIEVPA